MMGKEYIITTCAVWHTFEHGHKPLPAISGHDMLIAHVMSCRSDKQSISGKCIEAFYFLYDFDLLEYLPPVAPS